jgi:hypothetical protein
VHANLDQILLLAQLVDESLNIEPFATGAERSFETVVQWVTVYRVNKAVGVWCNVAKFYQKRQ